jgi:uncharacterized protein
VGNAVVHFEVSAGDDGPLVAFYGKVFGWELRDFPGGGYTLIDTRAGAGINGGIGRSQAGAPWSTFYVESDDLQASLDKATALGGRIVRPVTDFGGAVTTAMLAGPDGLLVGLVLAPAEPARDAETAPSAGSGEPVDWFEVMGSDAARTQHFYAQVFGWTIDDAGFPGYAVADPRAGRGIYGGIGGGLEFRWATIYAGVADFEQTLSRVESLGGSRIHDPAVPALKTASRVARYGSADDMKTGAFRDPAGNVFGIYQRVA